MWSVDAAKDRSVSQLLLGSIDEVWQRQRDRLVGLTQQEYLWEPVPGCWSVSLVDGAWMVPANPEPEPEVAAVTTVAWRIWHLGSDCLASYAKSLAGWPLSVTGREWYGDVDEALGALDVAWDAFRTGIGGLGDDGMWAALGEQWGPYAPEPWAALVVHAQDEVSHHGAELGVLRDLYAHRA